VEAAVDFAFPIDVLVKRHESSSLSSEPRREEDERVLQLKALPFRHAAVRFSTGVTAAKLVSVYGMLIAMLKLDSGGGESDSGSGKSASPSFNVLWTTDWLMVVPRSRDVFRASTSADSVSLSVNAIGYAGSFFVRSEAERELLVQHGPLKVLAAVGQPP